MVFIVLIYFSTDASENLLVSDPVEDSTNVFSKKPRKVTKPTAPVPPRKRALAVSGQSSAKSIVEKATKHHIMQCCGAKCSWNFTMNQVIALHTLIACKSPAESKLWLKQKLSASRHDAPTGNQLQLLVEGRVVCQQAFKLLYGFSNNKFYAALGDCSGAESLPVLGNVGNTSAAKLTTREHMSNWVTTFVEGVGDHDPTSNTVYIPR